MANGYFAGLYEILYRETTDGRRVTSRRLAPFLPKRWALVPPEAQARFERRQPPRPGERPLAGDEERPPAVARHDRGRAGDRPRPERDARQPPQPEGRGRADRRAGTARAPRHALAHRSAAVSGKMPSYRTGTRGSISQSVTASRQAK